MAMLTIQDVELRGKKVLMRVDFNVPQDENLNITDDTRIKSSLPSIKCILDKGAKKVILMSHLGRPKGKVVEKYSLKPVSLRLHELLREPVKMLDECVGDQVKKEIDAAKERVILLENLRFHPEEEENAPDFSRKLSELGEIYVNDAFGTAHRAHASTEGVTKYLKSVAGFLIEKEVKYLGHALKAPQRPFVIILGGAKVSDKIGMIDNLLPKSDTILIGGGMAYTFLFAQGVKIGNSKLEPDKVQLAKAILKKVNSLHKEILLPVDHLVVDKIAPDVPSQIVASAIPEGKIAVDIGPQTVELFKENLKDAKTIVWNGPLGIFEMDAFSKGTKQIAEYIAGLSATRIIAGGDTSAAVTKFKVDEKMTHISTGGGASLEFMEGKSLPGIAALTEK